ncbi:hypothetical protein LXA43DRAFT_61746 [Ganoderma leucocontextum]|nr:hypothetical protein LXA43DRAFT_61746 [Ganoderma leucocontextum]
MMVQNWQVLNVDRKERELAGGAKLGRGFWEDTSRLYKSLRIPCLPKAVDKWLSRGTFMLQWGRMGMISAEVLDMIFKAILDDVKEDPAYNFIDCLHLAVCCKQLLFVGKRHILRTLIFLHARAADCRLVCLGEYAGADDQAPPGMLTDAEHKEIATMKVPHEEDNFGSDEEDKAAKVIAARCLYSFASELYEPCASVADLLQKPLRHLCRKNHNARKREGYMIEPLYALDMDMVTALGCIDYWPRPTYPEGPAVLCNTSKGEYVLGDTLVVLQNQRCRVTLAHALLARICYSPDSSISVACDAEYAGQLAKGPWAGDKFRITTVNELPVLKDGKEWKDVTEEANKLLCHLWEREMSGVEDGSDTEAGSGEDSEAE